MGRRAGLDTVQKRKIPNLPREKNPGHLIVKPVSSRYTD
jgi:hypothetical protein